MKLGICRSCGASVIWCTTVKNKPMPVDAEPVADGNLVLSDDFGRSDVPAAFPALPMDKAAGDTLYKSHFATCPDAGKWRNR